MKSSAKALSALCALGVVGIVLATLKKGSDAEAAIAAQQRYFEEQQRKGKL